MADNYRFIDPDVFGGDIFDIIKKLNNDFSNLHPDDITTVLIKLQETARQLKKADMEARKVSELIGLRDLVDKVPSLLRQMNLDEISLKKFETEFNKNLKSLNTRLAKFAPELDLAQRVVEDSLKRKTKPKSDIEQVTKATAKESFFVEEPTPREVKKQPARESSFREVTDREKVKYEKTRTPLPENIKPEVIFRDQLKFLSKEAQDILIKGLSLAPGGFFYGPASTSGLHHSAQFNGPQGLLLHTQGLMNELIDSVTNPNHPAFKYTSKMDKKDLEIAMLASAFHDIDKVYPDPRRERGWGYNEAHAKTAFPNVLDDPQFKQMVIDTYGKEGWIKLQTGVEAHMDRKPVDKVEYKDAAGKKREVDPTKVAWAVRTVDGLLANPDYDKILPKDSVIEGVGDAVTRLEDAAKSAAKHVISSAEEIEAQANKYMNEKISKGDLEAPLSGDQNKSLKSHLFNQYANILNMDKPPSYMTGSLKKAGLSIIPRKEEDMDPAYVDFIRSKGFLSEMRSSSGPRGGERVENFLDDIQSWASVKEADKLFKAVPAEFIQAHYLNPEMLRQLKDDLLKSSNKEFKAAAGSVEALANKLDAELSPIILRATQDGIENVAQVLQEINTKAAKKSEAQLRVAAEEAERKVDSAIARQRERRQNLYGHKVSSPSKGARELAQLALEADGEVVIRRAQALKEINNTERDELNNLKKALDIEKARLDVEQKIRREIEETMKGGPRGPRDGFTALLNTMGISHTTRSQIGSAFDNVAAYGIIGAGGFALREAANAIREYELALINLERVYDSFDPKEKAHEMDLLGRAMRDNAVEFGETISNVGRIQEEWAKTGRSSYQEIQELTRVALLAKNTSDLARDSAGSGTENAAKAVNYLNSAINQMSLEYTQAIEVLDSWNKMADDYPGDVQDFAEAYQRSASFAANLGLDFHELNAAIALLIKKTGRDGREVGNALQTIFSNLTRPKAIQVLEKHGIQVRKNALEFRNFADIITDLSDRFTELDKASANILQTELADALGQTRRKNYVMSLLEIWQEFDEAKAKSDDSEGYSEEKNIKTMESLDKQIRSLVAALQDLSVSLAETGLLDLVKGMITGAKDAVNWFNHLDRTVRDIITTFFLVSGALALISRGIKMAFGVSIMEVIMGLGAAKRATAAYEAGVAALNARFNVAERETTEYTAALAMLQRQYNMVAGSSTKATAGVEAMTAAQNKMTKATALSFVKILGLVGGVLLAIDVITQLIRLSDERKQQDRDEMNEQARQIALLDPLVAKQKELEETMAKTDDLDKRAEIQDELNQLYTEIAQILPEAADGYTQEGIAKAGLLEKNEYLLAQLKEENKLKRDLLRLDALENKDDLLKRKEELEKAKEQYMKAYKTEYKEAIEAMENASDNPIVKHFRKSLAPWWPTPENKMGNAERFNALLQSTNKELDTINAKLELYDSVLADVNEIETGAAAARAALNKETEEAIKLYNDWGESAVATANTWAEEMEQTKDLAATLEAAEEGSADYNRALKELQKTYPDLIGKKDQVVKKIKEIMVEEEEYARKSAEFNRSRLEEAKRQIDDEINKLEEKRKKLLEVYAAQTAYSTLQDRPPITYGGFGGMPEVEDAGQLFARGIDARKGLNPKHRSKVEIDAINAEIEAMNKRKDAIIKNLEEVGEAMTRFSNSAAKGGTANLSPDRGNKYKALDDTLKALDNRVKALDYQVKILDETWKHSGFQIDVINQKYRLLAAEYKQMNENVTYIERAISNLSKNYKANAEKVEELKAKKAELQYQIIQTKNAMMQLTNEIYNGRLDGYKRQVEMLSKELSLLNTRMGPLTKNPYYMSEALQTYEEQMKITMQGIKLMQNQIVDLNSKIAQEGLNWQKGQKMGGAAGAKMMEEAHARAEAYREQIRLVNQNLLNMRQSYLQLRRSMIDMVSEAIKGNYEKQLEKERKKIEDLKETEQKRFEAWRKQKEKEFEMNNRREWEKDDYLDAQNKRQEEINKIQEQLRALEEDDSQWAIKKKKELQEELTRLQEEYDRAKTERERQVAEQEFQDMIEAEEEKSNQQIEAWDEELETLQEHYDSLLDEANIYSEALVAIQGKTHDQIVDLIRSKYPDYFAAGEEVAMAIRDSMGNVLSVVLASPELIEEFMSNRMMWEAAMNSGDYELANRLAQRNAEIADILGVPPGIDGIAWEPVDKDTPITGPIVTGHEYNMSDKDFHDFLANGKKWEAANAKNPKDVATMAAAAAANDALRRKYGMPPGAYPSYGGGGIVAFDQMAFLHKNEMVLPPKISDAIQQMTEILTPALSRIDVPRLIAPGTYTDNSTHTAHIDKVAHIEHAYFGDELDAQSFGIATAEAMKKSLRRSGVRIG